MPSLVPEFVAKTQNPSDTGLYFEEFTILPLWGFVDKDGKEMLLYLIKALKYYPSRTEKHCNNSTNLFISKAT